MELSKEDMKMIIDALIKASNATETEWLDMEKTILGSYPPSPNENASANAMEMWDRLHQKIKDAMDRMKGQG